MEGAYPFNKIDNSIYPNPLGNVDIGTNSPSIMESDDNQLKNNSISISQKQHAVGFPQIQKKRPPITSIIFSVSILIIGMYVLDKLYVERQHLMNQKRNQVVGVQTSTPLENDLVVFRHDNSLWYKKENKKTGIPGTTGFQMYTFSNKNNVLFYTKEEDDGIGLYTYRITGNQSSKIQYTGDKIAKIHGLSISPDNSFIAFTTNNALITYSLISQETTTYPISFKDVYSPPHISPDSKRIAIVNSMHTLLLINTETNDVREISLPTLSNSDIIGWLQNSTILLNQKGNINSQQAFENKIAVLNIDSEIEGQTIKVFQNTLFAVTISQNSLYYASREASIDAQIRIGKFDLTKSSYDETFLTLLPENTYVSNLIGDEYGGVFIETFMEGEQLQKIYYLAKNSFELVEVENQASLSFQQ